MGSAAAHEFVANGFKITALQDYTGTIIDPSGINLHVLDAHIKAGGNLSNFTNSVVDNDLFWSHSVDILVPAALELQITAARQKPFRQTHCRRCNGPICSDADPILDSRGIIVIPDVLANAGGVTVSYF